MGLNLYVTLVCVRLGGGGFFFSFFMIHPCHIFPFLKKKKTRKFLPSSMKVEKNHFLSKPKKKKKLAGCSIVDTFFWCVVLRWVGGITFDSSDTLLHRTTIVDALCFF